MTQQVLLAVYFVLFPTNFTKNFQGYWDDAQRG